MEAQMTYKSAGDIVTSEGVASLVQVFGSVADVLGRYNGALRSSMSYVGADNLDDYRQKAVFRLVGEGVFSQQKARGLQTREITI
jgi:IMP dehydrogenase/GMP reductase